MTHEVFKSGKIVLNERYKLIIVSYVFKGEQSVQFCSVNYVYSNMLIAQTCFNESHLKNILWLFNLYVY